MSTTRNILVRLSVAAAVLTASAVAAGAPAAAAAQAEQERYVASCVAMARDAGAYSQMGDYVRVLEYWHDHHDWGLGS